jgi:5-methylcytosine-specific restriction endonuclease McrA
MKVKDWLRVKEEVKKRDGYRCRKCGSSKSLIVHHKDGTSIDVMEKANNKIENLESFCRSCHIREHWRLARELEGKTLAVQTRNKRVLSEYKKSARRFFCVP